MFTGNNLVTMACEHSSPTCSSRGSPITDWLTNLGAVTNGNIIGGSLLVAGVYRLAYLRDSSR